MFIIQSRFLRLRFLAAFLALSWVGCAVAQPLVEWVTPPAWLQTDTEITPARPGVVISAQAVLTTGRGGKALVRVGREQVQIDENSLWEWSGPDDASVGNAVQGHIHVGTTAPRALAPTQNTFSELSVRLYPAAPWALVLDAGESQGTAQTLVQFLSNSGYPVNTAQAVEEGAKPHWTIRLDGFMRSDEAANVGAVLMALAPGILAATPKQQALPVEPAPLAATAQMTLPALAAVAPKLLAPSPVPIALAIGQASKKKVDAGASKSEIRS